MRETLIKKASSSLAAALGMLLLLIFIVAMKHPQKKVYNYLALGDSYTIGEKVAAEENFPNQTVDLLRKNGFDFTSPKIVAKTGWTTDELEDAIRKTKLDRRYDFVTLLIGVNNQYRQRDVEGYAPEFETLLQKSIDLAGNNGKRVIVLSIPDWGTTPFAEGRDRSRIAREINAYNQANKLIAGRYNVHYIDITELGRESAADFSYTADDGLHPSGKEYQRWADSIARIMQTEAGDQLSHE